MAPIKAFIAKYPKSPLIKSAYDNMGFYYGYQATKEEAAVFFPEYIAKYPNDPAALESWLNRIIRDKGPADKGVELAAKLEELTKFNPSPSVNQALAQAYMLKNDKAKAEKLYGKDFIENKVSSFGYDLIGWASYQAQNGGDLETAIKMGETALKLEPDSAYFLGQVAGLYVKANQLPKALQIYGPAYSRNNVKDATALYQYAGFWARQEKNLDDALVAAKKAVELMPTYYIYNTLSQVYQKMKNMPEAIKAGEKALDLAPDAAKTYYKQALDKLKNPAPAPDKK
jgi:tetratricopeptide (TPR) repeat protein